MIIVLDRHSKVPLRVQIVSFFEAQIQLGVFPGGTRLPSVRSLAKQISVNPSTTREAYAELAALDLVEGQGGRGTFVRMGYGPVDTAVTDLDIEHSERLVYTTIVAQVRDDILSLDQQIPAPESLPLADLELATRHIWNANNRMLHRYGHPQGFLPLRQQFAQLLAWRGITGVGADDLLVTAGVVQSLRLCLSILCRKGDSVIVETPTSGVALAMLEQLGLWAEPVPMTAEGIDVDAVDRVLQARRACAIFTVPCGHNPTGITSTANQRGALLRIAQHHGVPIIEDDIYGLLGLGRPETPSLAAHDEERTTVFYMTGTSKSLGPSVRIGCLMPPTRYLDRFLSAKQNLDLYTGQLAQCVLERYLAMGRFETFLQRITIRYKEMRDDRIAAVRQIMGDRVRVETPMGGFALWLRLPADISARNVVARALRNNVYATPGPCFFPRDLQPEADQFLRLSYIVPNSVRFRKGLEVLARAFDLARAA